VPEKPTTAAGYDPEFVVRARATCLHMATILGDFMGDLVVVGGLVPALIIDQGALPPGAEPHVGTLDLDLGLALAVLDEKRYQEISERLRRSGFRQDQTDVSDPLATAFGPLRSARRSRRRRARSSRPTRASCCAAAARLRGGWPRSQP
jgi:hypothetical protein